MRTRQTLTISLPPVMLKEFERVRKAENRTNSELVREALRHYFSSRLPVVAATKAELARIAAGRVEIRRGDYVTIDELLHGLDATNRKARRKSSAEAPRT